jgi:hypothetical protein
VIVTEVEKAPVSGATFVMVNGVSGITGVGIGVGVGVGVAGVPVFLQPLGPIIKQIPKMTRTQKAAVRKNRFNIV